MSFSIPNVPDIIAAGGVADQGEPDSQDFRIITDASGLTGVVSGCAVTAQGSPDMTVAVASGSILSGGTLQTVTSGNVTISAADGTNPRYDLVVADSTGAKQRRGGTASTNPVFPTPSAGDVVLAAVYVPAADTAINTNQIVDKRVVLIDHKSETNPHGQYLLKTIWDAKGDLISASANDTPSVVTVGSNYAVLVADSSQTAGLKWQVGPYFAGCRASRATTQAFTDSAQLIVAWTAEDFDPLTMHDNSTNPSRFTVPTGYGGLWRLTTNIRPSAAVNRHRIEVYKNNSTLESSSFTTGAATVTDGSLTDIFVLAATDYLEIYYTGFGVSGNLEADRDTTFCYVEFLGPQHP